MRNPCTHHIFRSQRFGTIGYFLLGGHALGLSWRSTPLGDLRWSLAPGEALRGRIGGDLQLTRPDGSASTHVSVTFGGVLRLTDTKAALPVELLSSLPIGLPRNWRGRLSARKRASHFEFLSDAEVARMEEALCSAHPGLLAEQNAM